MMKVRNQYRLNLKKNNCILINSQGQIEKESVTFMDNDNLPKDFTDLPNLQSVFVTDENIYFVSSDSISKLNIEKNSFKNVFGSNTIFSGF
jgi:hypothetical protein